VKTVIVGCGRVGAALASAFDQAGHEVIILDLTPRAFDRLPSNFKGTALRGDGTDEDILRRAGTEGADIFIALTEGDNRNVMAAQLAQEALGAKRVIAKINDAVRADAYADLGIAALCRTNLMVEAVKGYLGLPQSGLTGILQPTGSHPGGEHHDHAASGASAAASGTSAAAGSGPAASGPAASGPAASGRLQAIPEPAAGRAGSGPGPSDGASTSAPSGSSAGPAREV
jgi:trk system potassium uptake protein TrkA